MQKDIPPGRLPVPPHFEPLLIRLTIDSDNGLATRDLITILEAIDGVLREAELSALKHASPFFDDLSFDPVAVARGRLLESAHQTLRIRAVSSGSVVIEGGLVALGYWFLKSTLAESVKEGYKASDLNKRLADASRRMFDVVASGWREIGHRLSLVLSGKAFQVIVRMDEEVSPTIASRGERISILVPAASLTHHEPSYGEVIQQVGEAS